MISDAQLLALESAAESWVGTPFCEGTPVKGAGVSCHHLVAEVYFESGLVQRLPVPNGPSHQAATLDRSLITDWIESSGLFETVEGPPQPGDMLGFRVVNAVHHAAIQLGSGRIVHSVMRHGVLLSPNIPSEWQRRLAKIWRPKSIL